MRRQTVEEAVCSLPRDGLRVRANRLLNTDFSGFPKIDEPGTVVLSGEEAIVKELGFQVC